MACIALITAIVSCSRSQDFITVNVNAWGSGYMSYSRLLDLRTEDSRAMTHVKRLASESYPANLTR